MSCGHLRIAQNKRLLVGTGCSCHLCSVDQTTFTQKSLHFQTLGIRYITCGVRPKSWANQHSALSLGAQAAMQMQKVYFEHYTPL